MTLQSDTTGLRSFRPELTRPFRPRPKTAPFGPHRDHVRQAFSIVFNFYSSVSVFLFFLCLLYNVCNIFHLCVCLSVLTSVFPILNDNVSFALCVYICSYSCLSCFVNHCFYLSFFLCFMSIPICVVVQVWVLGDQSHASKVTFCDSGSYI